MTADHYAIAIGIDTYAQLRRLNGSVKDASEFCAWLVSPDGGNLPDKNVALIPSPPTLPNDPWDAKPIQREIDRALRDFGVAQRKRIGRRLYFYFAGHGFGPKFDDVGMLMADAAMDRLRSNLGLRSYRDWFHETKRFDEIVYILDCCRDRDYTNETAAPVFDKDPAPDGKRVTDFVVMATAYGDKAFAPTNGPTNERRGLLTTAVLEGLRGDTRAVDAEGRITASSLREYVIARVPELARNSGVEQTAEIPQLPITEIVFREINPATLKRIHVHIIAPPEINGELVLRHGTHRKEIERRQADLARAAAPWDIQLPINSRYEIEHTQSDIAVILDPSKAETDPYVFQFPRP